MVAALLGLDEAQYLDIALLIDGLDEGSAGVYDATVLVGAVVVAPRLVEHLEVLGTGVHLTPAHTADIGIHPPDAVVMIVA